MSEQKVYVGNGKQIDTQYGKLLKLSFSRADLAILENHLNDKGYVNLNCNERKSVSEWGHTHSMQIDDWVPTGQQNQGGQSQQQQSSGAPGGSQYSGQQSHQQSSGHTGQAGVTENGFDNFDSDIPF